MFEILSYQSVSGLEFGSSVEDVLAKFGTPVLERTNSSKEREFHYPKHIVRFDCGKNEMREVTLLPGASAVLNGMEVGWDYNFLREVSAAGSVNDTSGFLVSKELGIVLTGFHDGDEPGKAIHVFRKGDWDTFLEKSVDFQVDC